MAGEGLELPEELDKLEITPNLPHVKLLDSNLPVQLNPFFDNDLKDTGTDLNSQHATDNTNSTHKMQTNTNRPATSCRRCRYRRASESVLDELKYDTATTDSPECNRTPTSGILKQTLKKTAVSVGAPGNRKVLLREPVLKALQTCFHPHSSARRSLVVSVASNVASADPNDGPLTSRGMSDFRNLIDECRNLLSEEVDFTGRLNQLCLNSRNSKNFTTLRNPKNPTGNNNKLRNNATSPIAISSSSLSSLSLEDHQHQQHHLNGMSLIQPPLLGHSFSSTNSLQQRNSNSLSPEHARCSTTCSQQAGNSASAAPTSDDVTIDELASYFDTFVHIPKKMSSMAEMMYI